MLDQVYDAIADPTRRTILGILAEGDMNVGSLAERRNGWLGREGSNLRMAESKSA